MVDDTGGCDILVFLAITLPRGAFGIVSQLALLGFVDGFLFRSHLEAVAAYLTAIEGVLCGLGAAGVPCTF